jgi:RND family efflux transporter MFP subunit
VREVLVLEGQSIEAGDVVARLVDDDAKLAVRRAEAEVATRRADLRAAQANWDNPVERDRAVAFSNAAVEETRAESAKLDADIAAEAARTDELADTLRRMEQPAESGAVSRAELVNTQFRLGAQRAVLDATKAKRPVLEATLRQRQAEAAAAAENRRLRVEETQKLESAKAAVALAEVQLAEAQLRLSRMEIRSPSDGVAMTRLIEPGAKLMVAMDEPTSAQALRLYDPAKLQVRVDVPLADAANVGVGMLAQIVVEVLPDRVFKGEVTRVVNEADITKNTLQFKVRILDPAEGLKPEMLARVRFLGRGPPATQQGQQGSVGTTQSLFLPQHLVRRDASGAFAVIVDRARNVAVRRNLTLGRDEQDGWVAVTDGLRAGDAVIAEPAGVSDGQRVRVIGETRNERGPGGAHGVH